MQKEQTQYLNTRLAQLDDNERKKLFKRAALLRKIEQSRNRRRPDEESMRSRPLDEFVFKLLKDEDQEPRMGECAGQGLVTWLGPKTCRVDAGHSVVECHLSKRVSVAIGDTVDYSPSGEGFAVCRVKPRLTVLSRPDVGNGNLERVIAANIDVVVVVVSVVAPPLHPKIIDRYMIAIQRGGAKMILAVNKCDLLDEFTKISELDKLAPYRGIVHACFCSTADGSGIGDLENLLAGQTCAFVGHSGVGKSSLINAIAPSLNQLVGEVSAGYGRGTHTTTSSTLHKLPGGTRLIDTPGVRSFGLWDIDAATLPWYFPEFEEFSSECKFRNCTHSHEPSCAVKSASLKGSLSHHRYETYLRILTSLE